MDEEVQMEENGQQYIELVNDMTEMLNNLEPPLSTDCCIRRVPSHLRRVNEESYTPKVVSIGPYHHGNSRFQTMEKKKVRFLNNFLERVGQNLVGLVSTIKHWEERIRGFYGDPIQLNSNDFVKMILLDVSFILEVFRNSDVQSIDFPPWAYHSLKEDFILLENQIPFFIIEKLYEFVHGNSRSLIQLTFNFFEDFNVQNFVPIPILKIKHFTDLLRIFHLPSADLLRIFQPQPQRPQRERKELIKHLYPASRLLDAGVKFKVSSSNCLLGLNFRDGVLEIPRIHLYDSTETHARNLMAFEQCHFSEDVYITDYYFMLDLLINTARDVDLLCDKGIMANYLGDSRAATSMVNNLNREIVWIDMSPDYYDLCKALNDFYDNPLHSWKATLRREYFSSPWITTSTIAAVIFLVLTIIQTVCSLIQVVPKHK